MPLQMYYADMEPIFFPQGGLPGYMGYGVRADGSLACVGHEGSGALLLHDRFPLQPEQLAPFVQTLTEVSSAMQDILLIADFEQPVSPHFCALLTRLHDTHTLVVPEHYARAVPHSAVLLRPYVPVAPFRQWLQQAEGYGRVVPELRPICCTVLPGQQPEALSVAALQKLLRRYSPVPAADAQLCCRFFTYRENGQAVFVFYDDEHSYRSRLSILESAGVREGIVLWQEYRQLTE